jgi:hypothetical protein
LARHTPPSGTLLHVHAPLSQVHAVGELLLEVGSPAGWGPQRLSAAQRAAVLARLKEAAAERGVADVTLLREGTTEVPGEGE